MRFVIIGLICVILQINAKKLHILEENKIGNEIISIWKKVQELYVLLHSTNEECRIASMEYLSGLENYEPWALKMLDASSKIPTGIASGGMMDFGSYTQCVQITKTGLTKNINGKYCLLTVISPENIIKTMILSNGITEKTYKDLRQIYIDKPFEWSICLPDACQSKDVFNHFEYTVHQLFGGLNVSLQSDIHCSTLADTNTPFTITEKLVLSFIAIFGMSVFLSTIMDVYKRNMDHQPGFEVIFSMVANTRWLITERKEDENLQCVDGIRVLTMFLSIIAHRYLMTFVHDAVNIFELTQLVQQPLHQVAISAPVVIDSFFLLGGLVMSYQFLIARNKGKKYNYFANMLHHYLRLTPSIGCLILIVTIFGHRFGSGPKWAQTIDKLLPQCQEYWWSALLNIQGVVNPRNICFLQTWYLTADIFNYALAPLLMFLMINNLAVGLTVMTSIIVAINVANFQYAMDKQWIVAGIIDKNVMNSDFFTQFYILPHLRASPYIIGMALGYLLYNNRGKEVYMSPRTVTMGWACSTCLFAMVLLPNCIFFCPNYVYNPLEMSSYMALHRSVWALALGWVVWACSTGYGGPANILLSGHFFSLLARISYSAFLIHIHFQFYQRGVNEVRYHFSTFSAIHEGCGDIIFTFVLGYVLSILVESPIYRLSLVLVKGRDINSI